jgi:hypothetical protein
VIALARIAERQRTIAANEVRKKAADADLRANITDLR